MIRRYCLFTWVPQSFMERSLAKWSKSFLVQSTTSKQPWRKSLQRNHSLPQPQRYWHIQMCKYASHVYKAVVIYVCMFVYLFFCFCFLGHSAIRWCCDHDRRHNASYILDRYCSVEVNLHCSKFINMKFHPVQDPNMNKQWSCRNFQGMFA